MTVSSNPVSPAYGDTIELPGIPGVQWEVHDVRTVTDLADTARAVLLPTDDQESPIRIGRASLTWAAIVLRAQQDGTWGAHPDCRGHLAGTAHDTLSAAASLPHWNLPALTARQVRDRLAAELASRAACHAHAGAAQIAGPDGQDQAGLIRAALARKLGSRKAVLDEAAAAYRSALAETLDRL